jgi:hypothetical protein
MGGGVARISDRDRLLLLLSDTTGLSNPRIRTELNLGDGRYAQVRTSLLNDGLIEKYVCRGGGIRLTTAGEKAVPKNGIPGKSAVAKEADLYEPLMKCLQNQSKEDGSRAVVCGTASLRARGQWQNRDVARITVDDYPRLRAKRVSVTTYEVKQFPNWNVGAVYEAASHHRFAHEVHVVLEWPSEVEFSLTDPTLKLDQIARECQRFGVGLATLHPYYKSFRLRQRLEAKAVTPEDDDVEAWLDYMLSRNPAAETEFDRLMDTVPAPGQQ